MDPTEGLVNPLPHRYVTKEPGIGGVIKARPEDFVVDELSLYEPSGSGEHLYVTVEKIGVSHGELISCLRRHFGVRDKAIGFAGMKDKVALTRQTASIHMSEDPPAGDLPHERIRILGMTRHTNKIRLGHLAGNRFSIRIREVEPAKVTVVKRQLEQMVGFGAPNYFGSQRFGYRRNNHLLGIALLREDWSGLLRELLGASGSPYPEYQSARRKLFDEGRLVEAVAMWTPADRAELVAIKALRDGRGERDACWAVGNVTRSFWGSALQSAVFNRVLDQRIGGGTLATLVEGDLAWKHDSGAVFLVTPQELARPELARRTEAMELSPSGPLWGVGMTRPGPAVAEVEERALAAAGISPQELGRGRRLQGARRSTRVSLRDPQTEAGADEHGPYIRVAFDLPPGAYATVLLREIMKAPE